jgi:hypothetical protein
MTEINKSFRFIFNEPGNGLGNDDIGNGDRFYEHHKNKLIYITELKQWHTWGNGKWSPISNDKILNKAEDVAKNIYKEAANLSDKKDRDALSSWASKSRVLTGSRP